MKRKQPAFILGFLFFYTAFAQTSPYIRSVSIEDDGDFRGYELISPDSNQLFVLAEHSHNIRSVPKATLKVLQYLHRTADVKILAIEHGASTAYMINQYLALGDTTMLRHIARNTMFWGKENWEFFEHLKKFNDTLPLEQRVTVKSIDIEYKMESAIFVINQLIGDKSIPSELEHTVGTFQEIYRTTKDHREQFQGLSTMYYYDREMVEALVLKTIHEIAQKKAVYQDFFEEDFNRFDHMILDMKDGLTFDYTNPNNNYRFRDQLIYDKTVALVGEYPKVGILCVIGMRHATRRSSMYELDKLKTSPLYGKICIIKISALLNKIVKSSDLKIFHYNYPNHLRRNPATLIKHTEKDPALRSRKNFDYTLFINENGDLTPWDYVYRE